MLLLESLAPYLPPPLFCFLQAEANYNMWKAAYEELNTELIRDIQRLCADRNTFFDPCFSTVRGSPSSLSPFTSLACSYTARVRLPDHPSGR